MIATTYHARPSQLLGLADEWTAYQLDALTAVVGRGVEVELGKGKSLDDALRLNFLHATQKQYREPPAHLVQRMKIPESGIW